MTLPPQYQKLYRDALGWKRAGYKVFSIDVDTFIEILENTAHPSKQDQKIEEMSIRLECLCKYVMSLVAMERCNEKIAEYRKTQDNQGGCKNEQ